MGGVLALMAACGHQAAVATDLTVGTTMPIDIHRGGAAADGSWMVLSQFEGLGGASNEHGQSERGQPNYDLRLMVGQQAGVPIGDFEPSPDDRFLVIEQYDRLRLFDVAAAQWTDLAPVEAEGLRDAWPDVPPLVFSERTQLFDGSVRCYTDFSADGTSLLYLDSTTEPRLVVRELDGGLSHEIDPGPGVLSWAKLMPAGDAVVMGMTIEGPGPGPESMDWPYPLSAEPPCGVPERSEGALTMTVVVGLDGGELGRLPGLYVPMGPGLMRPTAEGSMEWWRPALDTMTTTPVCNGRVLHMDPVTPRMLVMCDAGRVDSNEFGAFLPGRLRLETFEERVELGPIELDDEPPVFDGPQRYLPLQTARGPMIVDLDERRTIVLGEYRRVVAVAAGRALVQIERKRLPRTSRGFTRERSGMVEIVDLQSGATLETFKARTTLWSRAKGSGPIVVYDEQVIDMEAARVVGPLPGRIVHVTGDGRFLLFDPDVRQPKLALRAGMPLGPLRWFQLDTGQYP